MTKPAHEDINYLNYLLGHSASETVRLDLQADVFDELLNGQTLQDPACDPSKLTTVLDIATGSGVWLERARSLVPDSTALVGCDIALSQLKDERRKDDRYAFFQHDCLQPFPPEHQGKYDLVNIRLIVMAMNADTYRQVLRNAQQALKPGGTLQVMELNPIPPAGSTHDCEVMVQHIFHGLWSRTNKDPPAICDGLASHIEAAGYADVHVQEYAMAWGRQKALDMGLSSASADKIAANGIISFTSLEKPLLHFKDIAGLDTKDKFDEARERMDNYYRTQGWQNDLVLGYGRKPASQ